VAVVQYTYCIHTNNIENDTKQTLHRTTQKYIEQHRKIHRTIQKLGRVRAVSHLCGKVLEISRNLPDNGNICGTCKCIGNTKISGCYRNGDGNFQVRGKYLWNWPDTAEITPAWKFPSMVEMRLTLNMIFTSKLPARQHIKLTFKPAVLECKFRALILGLNYNL
jgi:hypothetical protein